MRWLPPLQPGIDVGAKWRSHTTLRLIGLGLPEPCLNPKEYLKYVLHPDTCAYLLSSES